jgi:hypothetical protein
VVSGSREENAIKQREKHFQAKHAPAKAGVVSGSREENAIRQREMHFIRPTGTQWIGKCSRQQKRRPEPP